MQGACRRYGTSPDVAVMYQKSKEECANMTCKGCQDRDNKIRLLNRQISILQESNRNLSRKLNELLKHNTM